MIRLLVIVVLLLYGMYAGLDTWRHGKVVSGIREAVKLHGRLDTEKMDGALETLVREGGDATVRSLSRMVRDPKLERIERQMAQQALARFAEDSRFQSLTNATQISESLAVDLEVPVEDLDEERLAGFLDSRDPAMRIAGARGLGTRKGKAPSAAGEKLLELLSDDPYLPVRAAAGEALARLGIAKAQAPLARIAGEETGELGVAATRSLGILGGAEARSALEKLLATHPEAAAEGLERIGDRSAVEPLSKRMASAQGGARVAAARALAVLGDKRGVDALVSELAQGEEERIEAAAKAASGLPDAALVERLIEVTTDRRPRIRKAAAAALARCPGSQVLGALKAMLVDADRNVRRSAVAAMAERKDPALAQTFRDLLKDNDDRVCESALIGLTRLEDSNSVEAMRDILHTRGHRPDFVRKAAWEGLRKITGKAPQLEGEDQDRFGKKDLEQYK